MNNWKQYTLAAVIVAAAGFAGIKGLHKNMPSDFRDAVSDVKAGAFENLKDQGGSVTLDKDISLPQVAAPVMATLPERGNTVRIYTGVGEPLDGFEVYRPGDQMFLDGTNVPVDTLAARVKNLERVGVSPKIIKIAPVDTYGHVKGVTFTLAKGLFVEYSGDNYAREDMAAAQCKQVIAQLTALKFPVMFSEVTSNPTDSGANWSCSLSYVIP